MPLTAAEFWFLDVVVELQLNLPVLLSPRIEEALNRPGHGLDEARVLETLLALQAQSFIEFRAGGVLPRQSADDLRLLLRAPRRPAASWYGLTAPGGAAWEAVVTPRWDLFVVCESDAEGAMEIEAATQARAEEELARVCQDPFDEVPVLATRRDLTLTPWAATYWKTLPAGHRISVRTEPVPQRGWHQRTHSAPAPWYTPPSFL